MLELVAERVQDEEPGWLGGAGLARVYDPAAGGPAVWLGGGWDADVGMSPIHAAQYARLREPLLQGACQRVVGGCWFPEQDWACSEQAPATSQVPALESEGKVCSGAERAVTGGPKPRGCYTDVRLWSW